MQYLKNVNFSLKYLHVIMALVEMLTGLMLLAIPSTLITLLFGTSSNLPTESTIGRIAGAALLSLGIACWLARKDEGSRPAGDLIVAMLFYNAAACTILVLAGVIIGLHGIALWPAVFFHAIMTIWCMVCLRK